MEPRVPLSPLACVLFVLLPACCLHGAGGQSPSSVTTPQYVLRKDGLKVEGIPNSYGQTYHVAISNFGTPRHVADFYGLLAYIEGTHHYNLCEENSSPPLGFFRAFVGQAPTIFLVDRGGCCIGRKIRNAYRSGAAAVLVVDNKAEQLDRARLAAEVVDCSGSFRSLSIPSALVTQSDGQEIKQMLRQSPLVPVRLRLPREALASPRLLPSSSSAPLLGPGPLEYEFWISSDDVCGEVCNAVTRFTASFREYAVSLEHAGLARFSPRYRTWQSVQKNIRAYGPTSFPELTADCIRHGMYCSPQPGYNPGSWYRGRDIVLENLRGLCVHKWGREGGQHWAWWDYVSAFRRRCTMDERSFNSSCAETVLGSLSIDVTWVRACMNEGQVSWHPLLHEQQMAQVGKSRDADMSLLPTLLINSRPYTGPLDAESVFRAISYQLMNVSIPLVVKGPDYANSPVDSPWTTWMSLALGTSALLATSLFYMHRRRILATAQMEIDAIRAGYIPLVGRNSDG